MSTWKWIVSKWKWIVLIVIVLGMILAIFPDVRLFLWITVVHHVHVSAGHSMGNIVPVRITVHLTG